MLLRAGNELKVGSGRMSGMGGLGSGTPIPHQKSWKCTSSLKNPVCSILNKLKMGRPHTPSIPHLS